MMRPGYKQVIKRNFSNAARSYDRNAWLQREVAEVLARRLKLPPLSKGATDPRVLDIGCGTGTLTSLIEGLCPLSRVFGIDIASGMLEEARTKLNSASARLTLGDMDTLPFSDSAFDAVASSLTFQWAGDLSSAFEEAGRVLRPGGAFVFSTFGPATLHELRQSMSEATGLREAAGDGGDGVFKAVVFPDLEEVSAALTRAGFTEEEVNSETIVRPYADMLSLLRTLKLIGARNPHPAPLRGPGGLGKAGVIKAAAKIYKERFPFKDCAVEGVGATYEVLYVRARKARRGLTVAGSIR